MHSFDASTLNFGEVVQHISPLNNYYWHFLIPPSGRPQVQKGVENGVLRPWYAQF